MARVRLREMTAAEHAAVEKLAHSHTAPAQRVQRAQIIWRASRGERAPAIAARVGLDGETVRKRIRRFNAEGLGSAEGPAPLGPPADLHARADGDGDRHRADRASDAGTAVRLLDAGSAGGLPARAQRASRCSAAGSTRSCSHEGLRWRQHETWFGERVDPAFAEKRGASRRSTPRRLQAVCHLPGRDGAGERQELPGSGPGAEPQRDRPNAPEQEIDYGRRGKGYIFGAFCPATGEAFTRPYPGRSSAHWVDFLEQVELWLPARPSGSTPSSTT